MRGRFFLDTNVLFYYVEEQSADKLARATTLVEEALASGSGLISSQVMQETISLITRKADHPSRPKLAQQFFADVLKPLCKIYPDSPALFEQALDIHARYKYSYYDSLIIAAALEADCTTLYSEDLHHGQKIGKLHITNPFQ